MEGDFNGDLLAVAERIVIREREWDKRVIGALDQGVRHLAYATLGARRPFEDAGERGHLVVVIVAWCDAWPAASCGSEAASRAPAIFSSGI